MSRNAVINYISVAVEFAGTTAIGFVQSMIIVRMLSKADFGQFSHTQNLLTYLLFISSWSMMFLAAREFSTRRDQVRDVMAAIIQARFLVTLPLPLVAVSFFFMVPDAGRDTVLVLLLGVLDLFVNCLGGDLAQAFAAFDRQRGAAVVALSTAAVRLGAVVFFFQGLHQPTQASLGASILIGSIVGTALGHRLVRRMILHAPLGLFHFRWGEIRDLLRKGAVMLPGRFSAQFYSTYGLMVVGWRFTLPDVALYRVALVYSIMVTSAAMLTQRITTPAVLRAVAARQKNPGLVEAINRHVYFGSLAGFLILLPGLLMAPWIIPTAYGGGYAAAAAPAMVILLQVVPMCALSIVTTMLLGLGRLKSLTMVYASGAGVALLGGWLVIPPLGLLGAALVQLAIQLVVHGCACLLLPRDLRYFWIRPMIFPLSGLLSGLLLCILKPAWISLSGLLFLSMTIAFMISSAPLLFRRFQLPGVPRLGGGASRTG